MSAEGSGRGLPPA